MAGPAQPADRYEPLPGLLGLPGFLLRKLSPPARRIVLAVIALLVAAGVVAAIVFGPRIAESNRERAAEQRLAEQRARAAERRRLAAEQRPRTGKVATGAAAAIAGVEAAITRDARARHTTGELDTEVRRTECETLGRDAGRLVLACTAITSEVAPSETTRGFKVGYPFRAAVSPATGRYGLCKTSGQPGEGSLGVKGRVQVELPGVCGGP